MKILELQGSYQLEELERLCEQTANQRTLRRLQAIYLRAQGKTPQEIAQSLNCAPKTIRTWIKLFNAGGVEMLQYRHTGGRTSKLSREQEESLRQYLREPRPDGRRWTLKALVERLYDEYGVHLSHQQMNERVRCYGLRERQSSQLDGKKKEPAEE